MSTQVQCPNCGGYKVQVEQKEMRLAKGKFQPNGCGPITLWFFTVVIMMGMGGVISGILGLSSDTLIPFCATCGIFVGIGVGVWNWNYQVSKKGKVIDVQEVGKYHYLCNICGNRWQWDVGTSLPRVTLRPDLIQKGEQRLEEERRKQEEDAAALYYLTHKK